MAVPERSTDILAAAVSSTMVVTFLVVSLLIIIAGLVVYFSRKFKQSSKETVTPSQPDPLYEDVLPSAVKYQEQDLELKENVAYGPLQSLR